MCDPNNSDEDIDNNWQSQRAIQMDNIFQNDINSTLTKKQHESFGIQHYTCDEKKTHKSDSLSDIDALLSELSSKYCTNGYTSSDTLKGIHKPQVKKSNPQVSESIKPTEFVTVSDSEEKSSAQDFATRYLNAKEQHTKSVTDVVKSKKRSPKVNIPKTTKQEKDASKKAAQEKKQIQKESKKVEELREKELKKMMNQVTKKLKPDEYLKQVEVIMCDFLSEKPLAKEIFNLLDENDVKHSKKSQVYPNSITWSRMSQCHVIVEEKLISQNNIADCEVILFILECDDFVAMIEKDELIEYFKTVQEIMLNKSVTIGLYGVNEYLRVSKNRQRRIKNDISQTKTNGKEFVMFDRNVLETYLTKLQVLLSICYRYLDTPQNVAALVSHMTKAVAQTPYKLRKQDQMEQAENYIIGDNKDCVLVDKNGNGLSRLWQQTITCFPLARLDLAESVMASYPTFNSLMQAYERCAEESDGEKLLEYLEIRRAAGPLTNFRKVGPEFSKKMFKYYNSRDPDILL